MNDSPYMTPEELTPAFIARLDQNWSIANEALDALLVLVMEHKGHCDRWYCGTEELGDLLAVLDYPQLQVVLRAALERMTTQ